ncbi:probable selenium-dependent hydroxylase accessory protein YqeC [Longilinea arvoryzae]|uniref:Probable selenium-dependent hydroxylase accessory protein YqeC n=2 Tax=Longilinea arvoryzae TaxID=360412 RepID=A0A0S7BGM4_9CHLR|nr:probable selenium-dependent hydroxylase accessory protein YqeC [Longilinea arvoryzae]
MRGDGMNLRRALRLDRPACVAIVGAGGKTSAMFRLARELPPPVIVTTTTHIGVWQTQEGDRWVQGLDAFAESGAVEHGVTIVTGREIKNERVNGLAADELDHLHALAKEKGWSLLIEADGSKGLPLKAPGETEPVIPAWAETVVVVAGLTGLGKPCNNAYIHRPEIFSELSGLPPNEPVGEEALVKVLLHPSGGLKGIPQNTRRVVLLNQANDPSLMAAASRMSEPLLGSYDVVMTGGLKNKIEEEILAAREPIAAVILAAGGSTRLGTPKSELLFHGKNFLENVIQCGFDAGLKPVVVVTNNAYSQSINQNQYPNIILLNNPIRQSGQSTSIRLGIQSLPQNIGGAVFLLCDQPQIPAQLVHNLVERHARMHAPVIAPRVGDKCANPILFDRCTFADLLALEGDTGGRSLFSKYPIETVPWSDGNILLDVDTFEDFDRLRKLE